MTQASVDRITYLQAAYNLIRDTLLNDAPEHCALSYGFPSQKVRTRIGECHYRFKSSNGEKALIIVHPKQWTEPIEVLHVLAHEMCHVVLGPKVGHRKPFKTLAYSIGLEGKATATKPGEQFVQWYEANKDKLPDFVPGIVDMSKRRKQTTRLRLHQCACDPPVKVRVARDVFDATCNVCGCEFVNMSLIDYDR